MNEYSKDKFESEKFLLEKLKREFCCIIISQGQIQEKDIIINP